MDFLIRGSEYLKDFPNFKLVGRDEELDRLSAILMRAASSSVVIVGPGGVGISALCMALQSLKADPSAPFDIVAKRLFWLDTDGLFSSGNTSKINEDFSKIMARLEKTPDSILIIEDSRDFVEACRNNGCSHFINDMMSGVKRGLNQIIFETRDEDYEMILKMHSDVKEHFTTLELKEPVVAVLNEIVTKASESLSLHHGITVDPEALSTAIELTSKYRVRDPGLSRAQPERSVSLIDRALSAYRLKAHRDVPVEISTKLREFNRNKRDGEIAVAELEEAIDVKKAEEAAKHTEVVAGEFKGFESSAVSALRLNIKEYQKHIDANKQEFAKLTEEVNSKLRLTKDMVMAEFAKISGIPSSKLGENEREKLKGLEGVLKSRIFGQDDAVVKLANSIKTARVVKRTKDQPLSQFMFIGPSGTGKTEISKVLAEALLGNEKELTRFDMAEYSQKHDISKLYGAPAGFEGYEAGGILTNLMRANPNRVILFDEIEKADVSIFNVFLSILSDSRLTDNTGRVVSFNDASLIFTSNIGQSHFLNPDLTFEQAQELAIDELNKTYRSEFLNRFAGRQNIVCFNRLGMEHIEKIVTRELERLTFSYSESGVDILMADEAINMFVADHYDPIIGARGLPGIISATLEPVIADLVLDGYQGKAYVGYGPVTKKFEVDINE